MHAQKVPRALAGRGRQALTDVSVSEVTTRNRVNQTCRLADANPLQIRILLRAHTIRSRFLKVIDSDLKRSHRSRVMFVVLAGPCIFPRPFAGKSLPLLQRE